MSLINDPKLDDLCSYNNHVKRRNCDAHLVNKEKNKFNFENAEGDFVDGTEYDVGLSKLSYEVTKESDKLEQYQERLNNEGRRRVDMQNLRHPARLLGFFKTLSDSEFDDI